MKNVRNIGIINTVAINDGDEGLLITMINKTEKIFFIQQ